ncbi:MAG TPA: roadblock/LC7 domain-containing protein [Gemmatimonadales bacterium]|nr:roadblock/LC7 domain-containing protein [Gemmatimonadales bacterium]
MILREMLEPAAQAAGVLGALVVSRDDGLVVAGALQPKVNGPAVAALAASLARRAQGLTEVLGQPEPLLMELAGNEGTLLAVPARAGLLLVAITARGADLAAVRRQLLGLAERVG